MIEILPRSEVVDVTALSQLFAATATSYKLLFFQAVLVLLQRHQSENRIVLPFREIAIESAALAWYPHAFFHLSFGRQDQTAACLDRLEFSPKARFIGTAPEQERLREAIRAQYDSTKLHDLLRYVPYRLLTPFFHDSLVRQPDYKKNDLIRVLADKYFASPSPPVYRFVGRTEIAVEIHPAWADYLLRSLPIVKAWASLYWVDYLQARNPNAPAISRKIVPPPARAPLMLQTEYWRHVLAKKAMRCLYSGQVLDPERFTLDHFVPWTFVCHDQLWNLLPVTPEANSAKGSRLPARRYLESFTSLQVDGLRLSHESMRPTRWHEATQSFVSDLHIPVNGLLDPSKIHAAYSATLPALIDLATQLGFVPGWEHP